MIKKTIFIYCFKCSIICKILNNNIRDILGTSDYNTHRNLINHLFKNQNSFYSNGQIDYKITEVLSKQP